MFSKATNLFVSIRSNLSNPFKAYIYEITKQANGLDKLEVKQLAQILGRSRSLRLVVT